MNWYYAEPINVISVFTVFYDTASLASNAFRKDKYIRKKNSNERKEMEALLKII